MNKKLRINKRKLTKISPSTNYFLSLASSIIYQQISTKAGNSIYAKFISLFPKEIQKNPKPENVLKFSLKELKSAGLSTPKAKYIRDLAEKFLDKTIDPSNFPNMSDQEIKEHLMQVKGIGPWTADMFLIFALNRKNILPVGDLAIQKGFQRAFNLRKMPSVIEMHKLAKPHKGDHTNLSLHLWQLMD